MLIKEIPIFFNSFVKRKPFLDVCFYFQKKYFSTNNLYLTIEQNDIELKEKIDVNLLTYNDIEKTSDLDHECHSRYYRHYYSLNYFKSQGHKYFMNCMDDGWINSINWEQLNKSFKYLEDNNADRIDLCGPQILYSLIPIDEDVSLIDPNNTITWYLTNQCSIWKIDTLLKIYEILGPVTDWEVEYNGSNVARDIQCKFLTFNTPVIDNLGINQRKVGINEQGKKLLLEYCKNYQLDFNTELEKFNKFI
jgi:hypothetical protein